MGEEEDLLSFITKMISIAQELRELNEEISDKKFAIVILGCLPDSFDNFLTSFNSKPADDLTWDYVKNLLTEEYFKRKDRIETRANEAHHFRSEDALYTQAWGERGRSMQRGGARRGGGRGSVHYSNDDEAMYTRSFSRGRSGHRGGSRGRGGGNRSHPYESQSLDRNVNSNRFQGSCYNCGQFGHQSKQCTAPRRNNNSEEGYFVSDTARNTHDPSPASSYITFSHEHDLALSTV